MKFWTKNCFWEVLAANMAKEEVAEPALAPPWERDAFGDTMAKKEELADDANQPPTSISDDLVTLFMEGKASMNPNPENFKDMCLKIGKAILQKFGGPQQYLMATVEDGAAFAQALREKFPQSTAHMYTKILPGTCDEVFHIHLADLGYSSKASTRPPPYLTVAVALLDNYLTNTFLTSNSETPLSLWDGPSASAARSVTLLFLAKMCMDAGWDLQVLHPSLYTSMVAIRAQRGTMLRDLQSIALENAQVSARGGIRQQHDCLTWLGKLQLLRNEGFPSEHVLKAWNAAAPKEAQLTGSKAQSLKFLVTLPSGITSLLLEHASKHGTNMAFTEDCWANKKIQVGSTTRSPHKEWTDRMRVTAGGLLLGISTVCHAHDQKCPEARQKLSKQKFEEIVQQAQLVSDIQRSLVEDMGVPMDNTMCLTEAFKCGDMSFTLELDSALSEKDKQWDCSKVTLVQDILRKHRSEQDQKCPMEVCNRNIAATNLEKEEFELVLKQMEHLGIQRYYFFYICVSRRCGSPIAKFCRITSYNTRCF